MQIHLEVTKRIAVGPFDLEKFKEEYREEYEQWLREKEPRETESEFVREAIFEMGWENFLDGPGVSHWDTDEDFDVTIGIA